LRGTEKVQEMFLQQNFILKINNLPNNISFVKYLKFALFH
jgi:hypothetical protein